MRKETFTYDKDRNKAVMFFTVNSIKDVRCLLEFGIREFLASYEYIKGRESFYEDLLLRLRDDNGLFMIDSGAFSFMGRTITEEMCTEEFWLPHVEKYVEYLDEHIANIFTAVNMDLDKIVGKDIVRKWNEKYFEPLEKKGLTVCYVSHESKEDPYGLRHFEEYCKKYRYVGVNQRQKGHAAKFFHLADRYRVRTHGFAWTQFDLCKQYPFFSVDSVTYQTGALYGNTFVYDGKNFKKHLSGKKYYRKVRRRENEKYADIAFEDIYGEEEDRNAVTKMNLIAWMGFRSEYLKAANLKLKTKYVGEYTK